MESRDTQTLTGIHKLWNTALTGPVTGGWSPAEAAPTWAPATRGPVLQLLCAVQVGFGRGLWDAQLVELQHRSNLTGGPWYCRSAHPQGQAPSWEEALSKSTQRAGDKLLKSWLCPNQPAFHLLAGAAHAGCSGGGGAGNFAGRW